MADKNIRDSKNWAFETRQLHIGQEQADPVTDARAVPIYASTSYVFHNSQHAADRFGLRDAGNIYGRLTNPTQDVFEQRIASLEGGVAALAVASGAAAINYTFQALAKSGIAVRCGLHCAPSAHEKMGTAGTVRVSPSVFTKPQEIDALAHRVQMLARGRPAS